MDEGPLLKALKKDLTKAAGCVDISAAGAKWPFRRKSEVREFLAGSEGYVRVRLYDLSTFENYAPVLDFLREWRSLQHPHENVVVHAHQLP